jgi:hypothetical protein
MSTKYISRKSKIITAKRFRDAFSGSENRKVGYIFLGKNTEYPNENVIPVVVPEINDTVVDEKKVWDTMVAAKKVIPGDVEFVIPIQRWQANTRYKQYDDTQTLDFLLSETVYYGVDSVIINTSGINYEVGDVLTVDNGVGLSANLEILEVDESGSVTDVTVKFAGSYTTLPTQNLNTFSSNTSNNGTGFLANLTFSSVTVYPMYAMNSEGNVYKCLCNNVSSFSQVEPIGDYTQNQGFIQTEVGENTCYLWKYMYNIRESNKFFTNEWMPVPFEIDKNETVYDLNKDNLVDGGLNKIVVTNRGLGYVHSTINVEPFIENTSNLTLLDDITLSSSNIKLNMAVVGTGLLFDTHIIGIDSPTKKIFLSNPTISSGGGLGNTIQVLTRVVVEGDGTGITTSVRLNETTTEVEKIDILTGGINYSRANVTIYGSATEENKATARAILPPKFGHGYNPAMELGSTNVMIVQRIGEVDSTENNYIPTNISFRQYGLLVNPYKYDENEQVQDSEANNIISQTTDITILTGLPYILNEKVYQGPINNPTFYGYVVSQDLNLVRLNETVGNFVLGTVLNGQISNVSRPAVDIKYPDLKPYAGDVLFAENIEKVERSNGQAEEIKLVFTF